MIIDEILHDDTNSSIDRIVGMAIDGTDGSQQAIEWAAKNVFRQGTDLIVLLHSRPNSEVAPFGNSYTDADLSSHLTQQFEDTYKSQSHNVLHKAVSFLKSRNFSVKAVSLKGDAREELTRKIKELGVNLLVIGSRGMGMVKRAFIGSTSDYLAHHAHCPVKVSMNTSKLKNAIIHDDGAQSCQRTVFVGMDGSESSFHALEWAAKNILKPETDFVVLLNVRPCEPDALLVSSFGTGYMDNMDSAFVGQMEAEERNRSEAVLKKAIAFLKSLNPKMAIKALALVGDAREELVLKVDELHADLFIVGSRGMGAVKRALIGSTSDHLVHHANCPVMVVKENMNLDKFEDFEIIHDDAVDSMDYRIIGIGIDGSEFSHHAVKWALANIIREETDLIILIHVRSEAEYSLRREKNIKSDSKELLQVEIDFLKSAKKKLAIRAISLVGDSRDQICAVAKAFKIDMIVVGSRGMGTVQRLVLGSTSDHLAHHSPCPVIVIQSHHGQV